MNPAPAMIRPSTTRSTIKVSLIGQKSNAASAINEAIQEKCKLRELELLS